MHIPVVRPCTDLTDEVPTNGQVFYSHGTINERPAGTVASYACSTGYFLTGDSSRVCQVNGLWSSAVPVCECKLAISFCYILIYVLLNNVNHAVSWYVSYLHILCHK